MNRADFDILLTAALTSIEHTAQFYAKRYKMADEWQDIAQDVILRLLTYSDHYDPDKGNITQWSAKIIINRLNDLHSERISKPVTAGCNDAALLQLLDDSDIYSDLQAAFILDNLNREARLYYEGYNLAEIAGIAGLGGKSTAKWRIDTCAKNLAKALDRDRPMGRRERVVTKKGNPNFAVSA